MANSKQIVYLSQAQYAELIANGTITVDGVTVNYDENDIYVTPQAEPVTDVRVAGTSVAVNGVANVPVANSTAAGVVKVGNEGTTGIKLTDGVLAISEANEIAIRNGANNKQAITPYYEKQAVYYGLAKAAGSTNIGTTVGTYTPEAKGAIQKMLGVSDLIATEENNLIASKAYAVGDVFTANGKLYKATAAIAVDGAIITDGANANCEETNVGEGFVKRTDYATSTVGGAVKVYPGYGITMVNSGPYIGALRINQASLSTIKIGTDPDYPIVSLNQHQSTFYGLAKAAGADEKDSTLPVGQYTDEAKAAIQTMLGIPTKTSDITNDLQFVSAGFVGTGLVLGTASQWAEGASF